MNRIPTRVCGALIAVAFALPLLALLHEILVVAVAAGLHALSGISGLNALVHLVLSSPVHTQILLETLGGVQPLGVAVNGSFGQALHSVSPFFLDPALVAPGAWVSAILEGDSTVIGQFLTRALVQVMFLIFGSVLYRIGSQGVPFPDWATYASRSRLACAAVGLLVQAQAIWAIVSLSLSTAPDLPDTGIGMVFSVVLQMSPAQYDWVMSQGLPVLIPLVLLALGLSAAWLIGKPIDRVAMGTPPPYRLSAHTPVSLRILSHAILLAFLVLLSEILTPSSYLGIAKTASAARVKAPALTPQLIALAAVTPTPSPTASTTPSATPLLPTATATWVTETATPTRITETATATLATETATRLPTDTPTPTQTAPSLPTPSAVPTNTATRVPTQTPTPELTPTASSTVTPSTTPTASPSATPTATRTPTPRPPTATPTRANFSKTQIHPAGNTFYLTVNGQKTMVTGMNYNVNYTVLPVDLRRSRHRRDFKILREAGVNAIIGWGVYDEVTLEVAHEYDIGVFMPFELDPKGAFENENYRSEVKGEWIRFIQRYQAFPALWGWNPGGDELLHRMETELHRTQDKLQAAADFLVELSSVAYSLDPDHVSIVKEPRDWYVPHLAEALRKARLVSPSPDPSSYFIFGVTVYGKPDGVATAVMAAKHNAENRMHTAYVAGEFAPFGLGRRDRAHYYSVLWDIVRDSSPLGGFAYVYGPDQPNPDGPNPYDPLRLLVNEFSLVDSEGKPVDGSLAALGAKWNELHSPGPHPTPAVGPN